MNTKFFIYFSEVLGKTVRDARNRRVGKLCDIVMKMDGEIYPKASVLLIRRGIFFKAYAPLDWETVQEVGDFVKLKVNKGQIKFERLRPKNDFCLCIDILDQQIVDVDDHKVVRVNDIHLLRVENHLYLAHVDVSLRGLVRRLGWAEFTDGLIRIFSPNSAYLTQEELISWKNTQVLTLGRAKNVLRLDMGRQKLEQIPPVKLADILEDLDKFDKPRLFRSLEIKLQRQVFTDLPTIKQAELIEQLEAKEAVSLLENIPADEAVDLLSRLPKRKSRQLMRLMETKTSKQLSKLLGFSKDSAGGLMSTEYLTLPQVATVSDAFEKIKESTHLPTNIYYIHIVDDQNKLLGLTALRNFINADPQTPLIQTCFPNNVFVRTDDSVREVALLLEKYRYTAIPVLNEEDILQGVITIDDVVEELIRIAWSQYKEKI